MERWMSGAALSVILLAAASAQTRVACLGDSITFGSGIDDRAHASFPAQLQHMLGTEYEVRGFGVGGATLRHDADRPYTGSKPCADARVWGPDIVVIVLGTNDTVAAQRGNWLDDYDWGSEAIELARTFSKRTLSKRTLLKRTGGGEPGEMPRVLLGSPPGFRVDREGLSEARRAGLTERAPRRAAISASVRAACAGDAAFEFVALDDVLRDRDVVDGVHPNPHGAERIALALDAAIRGEPGAFEASAFGFDASARAKLRAAGCTGPSADPSTWPRPAVGFRGTPAGWGGGSWWKAYQHVRKAAEAAGPVDVVFLGDSITQGLTGHTERATKADGNRPFDRIFEGRSAIGLGLSGDRTEHLLFRIEDGSLDSLRPKAVVLQIGVNNLNAAGHSADETFRGTLAVVDRLRLRFPEAKVLLCGPFSAGVAPDGDLRQRANALHARLADHAFGDGVTRMDLRPLFERDGALLPTMARDGIHITAEGKRAWLEAVAPTVESWLMR